MGQFKMFEPMQEIEHFLISMWQFLVFDACGDYGVKYFLSTKRFQFLGFSEHALLKKC